MNDATQTPTQPAPSLEQRATELARKGRKMASESRFAEDVPNHELAKMVWELAELVEQLAKRTLPR